MRVKEDAGVGSVERLYIERVKSGNAFGECRVGNPLPIRGNIRVVGFAFRLYFKKTVGTDGVFDNDNFSDFIVAKGKSRQSRSHFQFEFLGRS